MRRHNNSMYRDAWHLIMEWKEDINGKPVKSKQNLEFT